MNLGELLLSARKREGLTHVELAELANVDRTYLSKIEKHNLIPSMDIAARLCKVLKIDFKPIRNIIVMKSLESFAASTGSKLKIKVVEEIFKDPKSDAKLFELPPSVLAELRKQIKEENRG